MVAHMNEQQKQQIKRLLAQFSEQEKQDLKTQMGIDLDADLNPDTIDPELAKLLIGSGVVKDSGAVKSEKKETNTHLTQTSDKNAACSFCGKSSAVVSSLITSPQGAAICRKCIMQHHASAE